MSIESLKARLAHIPGIENLTMRLEGGKEVYSVGAGFAAVHPLASDAEIEAAILSVAPAPTVNATPLPTVDLTALAPISAKVSPAMTTPAAAHLSVKDMMEAHMATMRNIQEAQLQLLQATLERQVTAVQASVGSVVGKIDGQTDDFLSMMGQFTNGLGV